MSHEVVSPAYKTKLGNLTAKSILVLLADQANADGYGWPSVRYISACTEIHPRTVLRMMQVFIEIGMMTRVARNARGWGYQLTLSMLGGDSREQFAISYRTAMRKRVIEECRSDIDPSVAATVGSVAATVGSVAATVGSVAATLPPHPLIGVPVNDPLMTLSPQPPATRGEDDKSADAALGGELKKNPDESREERLALRQRIEECFAEEQDRQRRELEAKQEEEERERAAWPTADLAAKRVMSECEFISSRLERDLLEVIRLRMNAGEQPGVVSGAMIAAWKKQQAQGMRLRVKYAPKKFFTLGIWRTPDGWHWDREELKRQSMARVGRM